MSANAAGLMCESNPRSFGYVLPGWHAPANVHALTTTRWGGFSSGGAESLNLGLNTADAAETVERNRSRLSDNLQLPGELVWLTQMHGVDLLSLPASSSDRCADGAMTSEHGQVCAILTADCLPLFMCDRFANQVALIHVGWRGLAGGIVEKAVAGLTASPDDLMAWAGPSISQRNFEIGAEVREQIGGPCEFYRASNRTGYWSADLYGLVGHRLLSAGVINYGCDSHCTYRDQHLFYSYRRDTDCGRMASLIWKEETFNKEG